MRIFSVVVALTWMWTIGAPAQSIRVATYELDGLGLEEPLPDTPPTDEEMKLLRQVAGNLKPLDAELIVVHGVPDRQVAKRLATLLRPGPYYLAYHGAFKKGGGNAGTLGPPISIFTRRQPYTARATEWRVTGQIDWPGGFVFVGLSSGTNAICVYVAHLPGAPATLADRENPLMARRRDLAAQYLVHHANWLGSTLTNQLVTALITGDFVTDARGARAEGAVRILQQAGFKLAVPNFSGTRVSEDSTNAPPLLCALLARNAELISTAQVSTHKGTLQSVASYEVAPAPTLRTGPVGAAARPVPAKIVALDESILWIWVGGIVALSTACLFSVWLIRRAFCAAVILGRRPSSALIVDVSEGRVRAEPIAYPRPAGESYSGSTAEAASAQAALWQARALQAEERNQQAGALLHDRARPQLSQLLRERLIRWLTSQRRALLTSHEVGTQQVLELETRLHQIQGQFQDRLRNREDRIALLERDILAKEKTIRDLLRAQVRVASAPEREVRQSGVDEPTRVS